MIIYYVFNNIVCFYHCQSMILERRNLPCEKMRNKVRIPCWWKTRCHPPSRRRRWWHCFWVFSSSWLEHIKIPPSPSTSLCYSSSLHPTPHPCLFPTLSTLFCGNSAAELAGQGVTCVAAGGAVKWPRETGPRVNTTGADRRKGWFSCCITGRTTHHVALEPVTWGTADVASIDQSPARSRTRAWSCDWQVLVTSSFMHCLLLFGP